MGKGAWPQVVEVPRRGPTAVEGVPTPVGTPHLWSNKGKHKAVSESEVPRRVLSPVLPVFEGGPSGLHVFLLGSGRPLPSITICQRPPEISWAEVRQLREEVEGLQEEVRVARQECDEVTQARDTLLHDRDAFLELWEMQAEEIKQLWARLTREAVGSSTGVPGFVAPSAQEVEELAWGLHQATESEFRRREWLLREVAGARLETLGWAWEHRLLLDGLSLGVSYVVEELVGQATTLRVAQGAGRLLRLMEAHRHCSFVEMGAWLEVFMDRLWTPPLLEEIVQAAQESLEAEFGPRGGQGELQEGWEGGD
ncbi:hypothetical protein C0992_003931 [Termitomyces sp. T32_za158]|nr:hypothetical protein C0992_003931 [Termitomyces sp. T32_za158]